MNSKSNGFKDKLGKIHNFIHKFGKYFIIVCLILFCVLCIKNKDQFAERVAKGVPESGMEKIPVADGDTITQEFKANFTMAEKLEFRIGRNFGDARPGRIELSIKDSKGNIIFHVTPTMEEVDGRAEIKATMRRRELDEDRWYKAIVNQKLEKGETYTYEIKGVGIKKDDPLYIYTSRDMGSIFEPLIKNGQKTEIRLCAKMWTTQIDMWAIGLTIAIALGLIVLLLVQIKIPEKWNKWMSWALFIVNPWLAFYMVEKVFYNPISVMGVFSYALNIIWFYVIFGILLLIFNRTKYAVIVGDLLLYGCAIGNYFVMQFRGTPITPADIWAFGTAMDVADHYTLSYNKAAIVATIICLALCIIAWKLDTIKAFRWKQRLIALIVVAAVTIGQSFLCTRVNFLESKNVKVEFFNQKKGYKRNGFVLSFLLNVQYLLGTEPEGYSVDKVKDIAQNYEVTTGQNKALKQKPNVVVIMNETFSDLNVVNKIKTNKEVMPYINSMKENTIKGDMLVSVFGGGTSNSEYEFLTGNSVSSLPLNGNAYTQFVKHEVPSLATQLKEQGYDTTAFHPYKPNAWNRQSVYPLLGFENFLDESSLDESKVRRIRGWVSDESDYDKIIETFENRKSDNPLFMFNVTIQNHGGYLLPDDNFKQEITIEDEKKTEPAERYLSLIHESDRAFKKLIDYFKDQKEPTIVVMFGDHQPKLEDEFYELLYGKDLNSLSIKEMQKKFTVPFVIWANYDIKEQENVKLTSVNYLSTLMLKQTNLKLTPYNQYLEELEKQIPAINANGYVTKDGKNVATQDEEDKDKWLTNYQYLQYNSLLDYKHRVDSFFSVKEK